MGIYRAPLEDMTFIIDELLEVDSTLGGMPAFEEHGLGPELTTSLLDEAAKLAGDVLAPLRRIGDLHPAVCQDGRVEASPGYDDAIRQMAAAGWLGISAPMEHGGQGLPELYGTAVNEMWNGANMALALMPFLSTGAAMAVAAHGSDEQKQTYLEKMYSGEWAGTMNLTEADAGSDLGSIRTNAIAERDHYRIRGQKIFITWGDHGACDNIVHLVLARLAGAPEGSRGISLFLVPKYLVNADGSPGERNDVFPVSCEHKLGIHGSPTCVMAFGENEGAIGYLLGEENRGLACMFTMMNDARFNVGLQALGAADAAFQKATTYAREREQGGVPIINYPDVQRMLMTMKALTEAGRAFAYSEAHVIDRIHAGPGEDSDALQPRLDLMIPVIKGWLTEVGEEIASLAVQVHGGMGYVEETGAAQYLRDIRITTIYEGTTGIQATDLVSRKLGRDGGASMHALLCEVGKTLDDMATINDEQLNALFRGMSRALADMEASTLLMVKALAENKTAALGASFDYLMQMGYLLGGWYLARSALVAHRRVQGGSSNPFYARKSTTAVYYSEQILPRCSGHAGAVNNMLTSSQGISADWL